MATRITRKRAEELRETCEKWVEYWKGVLGLKDWTVTVRVETEKSKEGAAAWITYDWPLRCAELYLSADVLRGAFAFPVDPEEATVHELLHLWFAPWDFDDGSIGQKVFEQALNALAKGLVRLKREGRS